MILEIPEVFRDIGYYEGVSLILWIISIILILLSAVLYFLKILKLETKSIKMTFFAFGVFFSLFGFTRIVYIIAVYNSRYYDFYTTLGYIFIIIGLIFWLYVLESYVITITRRALMIICLVVFIIALIALIGATSRYIALIALYFLLPVSIGAIYIIYVYLAYNTSGRARKKAIGILIGMILIAISHFMDSELFLSNFRYVPLEITPIVMILGILVFATSQLYLKSED